MAPVCKSNTLTLLAVLTPLAGLQLVLKIGPSPTQISVLGPLWMIISPSGPEKVSLAGGIEQLPANCPSANILAILVWVSIVTTPGCDAGPVPLGNSAEAAS